jgi:tetratricopeptide (TPR) repeat protein
VEEYIASDKDPDREKLLEFLWGMAIRHLLDLLTESEKELLRASTLFHVPVPLETLEHMAQQLGLKGEEPVGERLLGFGLWEPFMDMVNLKETAAAIHALARPKAGKLSEEEVSQLACLVVQDLYERWGGKESKNRPYAGDIELARMALAAQNTTVLSVTAKDAVRGLENQFQYRYAAKLARESIEILDNAGVEVSDGLFRASAELSEHIGDMEHARTYIQRAVDKLSVDGNIDSEDYAYVLGSQGRMLVNSGELDKALEVFKEAEKRLQSDRFLRERAINQHDISRILVSKGEVDKALKLHNEGLEVFEKLGDKREKAITLGDIARIQVDRGQVDEALKLHHEMLQVFEELDDRRERAVTLGDIARIQVDRGHVDEALKLHHERLQVFEELGNLDSKAATLWDLAQIELQKESVETALQYLTESYTIFLKIGRLDGICMVGLYLGPLLCQAGQTQEGLKILERSREGFGKLGQKAYEAQAQELIEKFTGTK